MIIQYQGEQHGKATTFKLRIIGNNLSKSSSNYQIDLFVGDKKVPSFHKVKYTKVFLTVFKRNLFIQKV